MSKVPFKVVHVSSEDSDYPASELNVHNPRCRGWQSSRFCEFPQEIGLALDEQMCPVRLSQVQILSHQYKISQKIEIFVGCENPDMSEDADEGTLFQDAMVSKDVELKV